MGECCHLLVTINSSQIYTYLAHREKIAEKKKIIFLTERLDETTSCVRYRILNEDFPFHTIMESSSVSQIRILKNFIETKIHFSPSPLWFSGKKGKETCFGF